MKAVLMAFLIFLVFAVNLPVINMVVNSFHLTSDIMKSGGAWFSVPFSTNNYFFVFAKTRFLRWLSNSILICGFSTLIAVFAAYCAAYVLSRYAKWWTAMYEGFLLLRQMFPLVLVLIPLFITFRRLGLTDNPISVILVYSANGITFATLMLKTSFDGIPRELEEASYVDGCTRLQSLRWILLPLTAPSVVAASIFSFLFSFSEYMVANTFLRSEQKLTLPVGLQTFSQQFGSDWGSIMAGSTLAMIPILILFSLVQKYLVQVSIASGVKG